MSTLRRPLRESRTLVRFDGVERAVHWVSSALFLILIFTGAVLYLPGLMGLIGRRRLILDIHVYCGLALPVPLIVALVGRWGAGLREDLRRINLWSADDVNWFRSWRWSAARRKQIRLGKFNPGQKLNTAIVGGASVVMLATGVILRWYTYFPFYMRSGSTFVHNWVALGLFILVAGHILFALSHPPAMRSMLSGKISRSWARLHAPNWLDQGE